MKTCTYCAEQIQNEAIKCRHCSELLNNNSKETKLDWNEKLKWLGWWLILVVIALITTPFSILMTLDDYYISSINDWTYAIFTDKNGSSYIEYIFELLMFEIIWNLWIIIFSSILIYFFFCKHKTFPFLFKIYVISYFLFHLFDNIFYELIPEFAWIEEDWESFITLLHAFVYMIVWWSYMHISKRVKNTFVETNYKKYNIWSYLIIVLIILTTFWILTKIDLSKLTYNEQEYWNNICVETFWNNSYYTW